MKVVNQSELLELMNARGSATLRANLPKWDIQMMLGCGGCAVQDGDLITDGDWRLPGDNLLVLGSLRCAGLVDLAPLDGEAWVGSLWILGDLTCRNFCGHYGVSLTVDGNMTVSGLAVGAFEDANLTVTGDFDAHFYYGEDIWVEVGGRAMMEFGDGYALPLGYTNAAAQAVKPRGKRRASLALLNLDDGEAGAELAAKLRRGEHFRPA